MSNDIRQQIKIVNRMIEIYENYLCFYEVGSREYNEINPKLQQEQKKLEEYQNKYPEYFV